MITRRLNRIQIDLISLQRILVNTFIAYTQMKENNIGRREPFVTHRINKQSAVKVSLSHRSFYLFLYQVVEQLGVPDIRYYPAVFKQSCIWQRLQVNMIVVFPKTVLSHSKHSALSPCSKPQALKCFHIGDFLTF